MLVKGNQLVTTVMLTSEDRDLLDAIANASGNPGRSAIIRRLIREEGVRMNSQRLPVPQNNHPTPTEATA